MADKQKYELEFLTKSSIPILYSRLSTASGLAEWFADAGNGITEFFAQKIVAKKLCVSDDNGAETCITKDQLDALLAAAAVGFSGNESGDGSGSSGQNQDVADTEPPTITIIGNNPAEIETGSVYADLGATAKSPGGEDLSIKTFVNDVEMATVSIDTSTSTTYIIKYEAIDQAGNVGSAERTVIVGTPEEEIPAEESPVEEPPAEETPIDESLTEETTPNTDTDTTDNTSTSSTPPTEDSTATSTQTVIESETTGTTTEETINTEESTEEPSATTSQETLPVPTQATDEPVAAEETTTGE